jgi:hypothetical protein
MLRRDRYSQGMRPYRSRSDSMENNMKQSLKVSPQPPNALVVPGVLGLVMMPGWLQTLGDRIAVASLRASQAR